jgi:hypothetical protein
MRGLRKPINKPQCEPMRGGAHNLTMLHNAAYARAFGPLSCMCTRVCVCACACVCARTGVCVCMRVYTVVYVRTCVRALCTCACTYMCACTCVHDRSSVCVCMRVRVRACACEGIEGAFPLGVLPPRERASLPSCLSTLGALRGGLEAFPACPHLCLNLTINPNVSFARPL